MIPYNEREVLKLLQEESTQRKGFEMIVAQYSEQLYWQIRRMVLSHEDANDLLQNTFIKAWTNIDYFRAEAKLSTWLYRIALNECLTFLNKQRAMTTVDIDDPEAAIVQKLESDSYFSGDEIQLCLQKALVDFAGKTAYGVQPEILSGNEIRRDVGNLRHIGWCAQSVISSCGEENREVFRRNRLNLLNWTLSK